MFTVSKTNEIKYTSQIDQWYQRCTVKQRELVTKAIIKLANEIANSIDGRPSLGKSKLLKGVQSPIYEFRIDKDLRLLYDVNINQHNKELLLIQIADHDHLSRTAKHSVEHLVHAKKLDGIHWTEEDQVIDSFELEQYRDKNGYVIGKTDYEVLEPEEKENFVKIGIKELDVLFETWKNKTHNFSEGDYWTADMLQKGYTDACIHVLLPMHTQNEIFTRDEAIQHIVVEGKLPSKIALKPEQKKLLELNEQIFILEGVAGTGKTTLLEERFLIFIENNEWHNKVLFITHNKQLSKSVKSRLKKRKKKEDHEYINQAVIDIDSWYRDIEKLELQGSYYNDIKKLLEIKNSELRVLKTDLKDAEQSIQKLTNNIEIEKLKIRRRSRGLKNAEDNIVKLTEEKNEAIHNLSIFTKEIGEESMFQELSKKRSKKLNNLRKIERERIQAFYSNQISITKYKLDNSVSEDKVKNFEKMVEENQDKLGIITSEYPEKIKKTEIEIEELENAINEPFSTDSNNFALKYNQLTNFDRDKQITYDIFLNINKGKGNDSNDQGVLWEEYRGVILGHGKNFHSNEKISQLTKKEYLKISRDRGLSNKVQNTRLKVWEEIENFESKREKYGGKYSKANGGWIDQEQAKFTQKLLEKRNIKYQAIFIDEVQDLTELQIAIMLNLLEGKKKFEVAGDTSQSVYPSAFRWEDLRLQIYKTLENKDSHKHHRMDINYRSTPYLVDAANLILDEHEHVMGETRTTIRQRTDRLEKGNHPSIIRMSEAELINHLRDLNLPNVFCPLLVRDNTIVNRLSKELATDEQINENELNPNVMTIPGCKGLEYENVIIWDPCSGSNRLLDDYYHYKKGNSITDSDAVSLELRHLFVGITRSRYNLSLIGPEDESNGSNTISGLGYLEGKKEFSIENRDILKGFTKTEASSADFIERAKEFEDRGKYQLAADAYRSAGLSYDRNRCRGEYFQGINEYRKASDFFVLAANETNNSVQKKHFYSRANDCLDYVLDQEKDVDILDKKARLCSYIGDILGAKQINAYRYELLGNNNSDERSLFFKKAAKLFEEIGQLEDALRLYRLVDSSLDIAKISVQIGNENDFFNSIENYLKDDEKHFIILYSIFSGDNAWKKSISKLLKVNIAELPNSNIVLKKQLLYADDKQRSVLKLQGAKNWSETVQAYKEMGDYRKASEVLIENQYFQLALDLLLKEYEEDFEYDVKNLLESLKNDNGLYYLLQYFIDERVPRNRVALFEQLFPKNSIDEWVKYTNSQDDVFNDFNKHPIIKSSLIERIFLRDIFSNKVHPTEKNYNGVISINIILLLLFIREIISKGFKKSDIGILMSYYYLYVNNKMGENKKVEYEYFVLSCFIDSVVCLNEELDGRKSFGDEELYSILSQTYATIIQNEKKINKSFTFTNYLDENQRTHMILFIYSLFGEIIGNEIFKWQKSFDFIHYLYIFSCAKIFEDEGIDFEVLKLDYSFNIAKLLNGLGNSLSRVNFARLIHLESSLNIRGVDHSKKIRNHSKIRRQFDLIDMNLLAAKKISLNYEATKIMLRNTREIDKLISNKSWLENISGLLHSSFNHEDLAEKKEIKKFDLDIENDEVNLDGKHIEKEKNENVSSETVYEEIESEVEQLEVNEIPEIFELVPLDDENIKDSIKVKFPFEESLNVEDPIVIFRNNGEQHLELVENILSEFSQMMWDWKDEIDKRWFSSEKLEEKIALIAAFQYLIDKNKELDKLGRYKPSLSEMKEHGRRARTVQKELIERSFAWANRAIMA